MTSKSVSNLDKARLQGLLGAIGSAPAAPAEYPDAVEYDWTSPHYFTTRQRAVLQSFAGDVAARASVRLTALCQSDLRAKVASRSEHFTHAILAETAKQEPAGYYLVFATVEEQVCGFVDIPPQSAMAWAAQLLGGSDSSANSERRLSELEESLLSDAAMALVHAFSDSFEDRDFQPITRITRELPGLPFEDTDELCRIAIEARRADADGGSTANLVVLCRELLPVVGPGRGTSEVMTAEDASKAILDHLLRMPITVGVNFATTAITLGQAMTLESGDILLLNKKLDEPIELIVDGRTILSGWPARCENRHAFVVAEGNPLQEI